MAPISRRWEPPANPDGATGQRILAVLDQPVPKDRAGALDEPVAEASSNVDVNSWDRRRHASQPRKCGDAWDPRAVYPPPGRAGLRSASPGPDFLRHAATMPWDCKHALGTTGSLGCMRRPDYSPPSCMCVAPGTGAGLRPADADRGPATRYACTAW